jgi:hypothetical protein
MHLLSLSAPTLAVTFIYCIWQRYALFQFDRERSLRERVAYMLWVMAERVD